MASYATAISSRRIGPYGMALRDDRGHLRMYRAETLVDLADLLAEWLTVCSRMGKRAAAVRKLRRRNGFSERGL